MTDPAAARLARFVTGLSLDAVPPAVATPAALLPLDTVGNGLAAAREDFARAVVDVAVHGLAGSPDVRALVTSITPEES